MRLSSTILTACLVAVSVAAPAAPPAILPPVTADDAASDAPPVPEDARRAILDEDWEAAALALADDAEHPFLTAWTLVRADRATEAAGLLDRFDDDVPAPYAALVTARVHAATDRPDDALSALSAVPAEHPLAPWADLARAEALVALDRADDARALLTDLTAAPSPATPDALWALAAVSDGDDRTAALRALWTDHPTTLQGQRAFEALADTPATWQQAARRAEALMDASELDAALALVTPLSAHATGATEDACRLQFVHGRSLYRKNRLTDADRVLGDLGARCADTPGDYGPRALYLQGMADERRSRFREAADTFVALADRYPDHRLADDALNLAGYALAKADAPDRARALWRRAVDTLPSGDMVPEIRWRLAWTAYLEGDPETAIREARALSELPLDAGAEHVQAGAYWAARWTLYPDVSSPNTPSDAPDARERAVAGWRALFERYPYSYQGAMAFARITHEDPDLARTLAARPAPEPARHWTLRPDFAGDPAVREAAALTRLGLYHEALTAFGARRVADLTPQERAWWAEVRYRSGDRVRAHAELRSWLTREPAGLLTGADRAVLPVAFPDWFLDEVTRAAAPHGYDPRLLHALTRVESNFDPDAESYVGALGLTQLMPFTARRVAGWLDLDVPESAFTDPGVNTRIGGRYLAFLLDEFGGNPLLAAPGYNAGEHRITRWLGEWGNVPSDEFVERIPYAESRGYAKKVVGTWQAVHRVRGDGPGVVDLSAFVHAAVPVEAPADRR